MITSAANVVYHLGVLTKPDRIPSGEESAWVAFIRGEKEALDNNWYCVKQPSSTDIKNGITWSEARQRENDFFSTVDPWASLDSVYQRYLRTSNLVERLSHILSDLISKRLVVYSFCFYLTDENTPDFLILGLKWSAP